VEDRLSVEVKLKTEVYCDKSWAMPDFENSLCIFLHKEYVLVPLCVCNHVRLHIPIGIAYESDLKKAKALALSAATSIDRILKVPEPKCLVMEYGDSTVNLELRVWIDDPKNGIDNVKDAVLLAVWDSFHANDIEIAFPQRDLHIKSAVPLKILKNNAQPVAKDSLEITGNKKGAD
jgi:small-conductance mechanosensitive channel